MVSWSMDIANMDYIVRFSFPVSQDVFGYQMEDHDHSYHTLKTNIQD